MSSKPENRSPADVQSRRLRVAIVAASAVFGSGFWVFASSSWSTRWVAMLLAHYLLGAVWGAAVLIYLARRGAASADGHRPRIQIAWFAAALITAAFLFVSGSGRIDGLVLPVAIALAAFGVTLVFTLRTGAGEARRNTANFLLLPVALAVSIALPTATPTYAAVLAGAALLSVACGAAMRFAIPSRIENALALGIAHLFFQTWYSGVLILSMGMGRMAAPAFWWHRITAACLTAVCLGWVLRRACAGEGWGLLTRSHLRLAALLTAAFVAAVAVDAFLPDPTHELHLSTIPNQKRTPDERIDPQRVENAGLLSLTRSCGQTADCHPRVLKDYLRSTHNRSMQTPHFQKNMDFMVDEIGKENENLCAGCHHPQSLFDPSLNYKDFASTDNMSCVFCHVVSDVRFPTDRRRTVLDLTPNMRHLAWLDPDGEKEMPRLKRWLINLHPAGHARALKRPVQFTDELCQACHRLQISPTKDVGLLRSKCIDCHMQTRDTIGLEGHVKNHRFPGTNMAVPYVLGDYEQVEFTRRFLEGEHPIDIDAWGQVSDLGAGTALKHWLEMHFEPRSAIYPGEPFRFTIGTANNGVDHAFPAAPLDLIEVWLEVALTDDDGRVLMTSGHLDAFNEVPVDAHRMGGYMIGEDGEIVEKNRVWQIKKKIVERQLAFGQRTSDVFETALPEDVAGPLHLVATWNYRKLNQKFVNWAYGEQETMPIGKIAHLTVAIPLDPVPGMGRTTTSVPDSAVRDQVVAPVHP